MKSAVGEAEIYTNIRINFKFGIIEIIHGKCYNLFPHI